MTRKILKLLTLALVALVAAPAAFSDATTFEVDAAHSTVEFKIRHLLTRVSGNFRDFAGEISWNAENPAASKVEFVVQAASIDTGNDDRDKHLRSPDFFDAENHATLSFKSKKVSAAGEGKLSVTGDFTMHGVTKTITIPVEIGGVMQDPWGRTVAGFEAEFEIDRKDFGMVWNKLLDQGGAVLGDTVKIFIGVEAAARKPAEKEEAAAS
ncbi:MAG: YceI family protein [Acidobacteriota bacterium]|nr:YceI family protein [Acidobacteriota bacterium]